MIPEQKTITLIKSLKCHFWDVASEESRRLLKDNSAKQIRCIFDDNRLFFYNNSYHILLAILSATTKNLYM